MIVNNASLFRVAVDKKNYPQDGLPEIAFAGRSNVGKSSLINALTGRKALARSSATPGKTRTLNFYLVENKMYLVDMPGYGYAKVSKTEAARFGLMAENYIKSGNFIKCVVLVIDSRHEPTENDKIMLDFLRRYNHRVVVAATKVDKLKRSEINQKISIIEDALELSKSDVLIQFSSETKMGKDELWIEILREVN